jgi:hypothetical protein
MQGDLVQNIQKVYARQYNIKVINLGPSTKEDGTLAPFHSQ